MLPWLQINSLAGRIFCFFIDLPATNANLRSSESSLVNRHRGEFEFALVPNWDGLRSVRLTDQVVRLADKFISDYAGEKHLREVGAGNDGSLGFVWDDGAGNYAYLDVGPSDTIHLYYDIVGTPKWEGVSVADDPEILGHMRKALAFTEPAATIVYRWGVHQPMLASPTMAISAALQLGSRAS